MTEFVKKLIERLEESAQGSKESKDLSKYSAYKQAIEIVNELAEEYQPNQAHQFAILHADILARLGVDISSVWETATQQAEALEQAYLRGRQDEKETVNDPITNADRIRAMSDNQLCDFLSTLHYYWNDGEKVLILCDVHVNDCRNDILEWLQKRTETHE